LTGERQKDLLLPLALVPPTRYHCAKLPFCLQVSADGRVLRSLHDPTGATCHAISSAVQVGGTLYMGSLGTSYVCGLSLADL